MDAEKIFYLVVAIIFTLIYLLLGVGLLASTCLGLVSSLAVMVLANSGFDL